MHAKAAFCSNTSLSADRDDIPYSLVVETSAPSVFDPNRLSQHKVFENELSIPTGKWCSARPTRHVVVNRLRSTFAFHDLIERLAFRACEGVTQHIAVPIRCSVPRTTIRTLFNSAMSLDCHSRRSDLSRRMSPIPFGNTRQAPHDGGLLFSAAIYPDHGQGNRPSGHRRTTSTKATAKIRTTVAPVANLRSTGM